MAIRKWLCRMFCDQQQYIDLEPFPIQESTDRILAGEVVALFDSPLDGDAVVNVSDLHITDRTFKLVDIDHLREFLLENPVSERKYIKERHDCDDFCAILNGDITRWDSDLAFGIIHGRDANNNPHAWNLCIGIDKKIYFIEPQDDNVWKVEGEWNIWLIMM